MCGICGISGRGASETRVRQMTKALGRRGPDGNGTWLDAEAGIALGHTRLSIIDLSSGGHQPMSYADGRYHIVFNGEIYNYVELRRQLKDDGAVFLSQSDTEVILAAFRRWGTQCLQRLRGMFAFALWDRDERRLYLVRDRLGIKPLLFAETPLGIIFASEIKSLLASGIVDPVIEPQAIFDLLANGSVCQPGTILRGVRSIEPGTCITVESNGKRKTEKFWDFSEATRKLRSSLVNITYKEAQIMVREKLEEACRYHLVADVPVGSFLSGGLDSTSITALMSLYMPTKVKSFSIGFEQKSGVSDELYAARQVAKHIGCEHTEAILTTNDIMDSFDDLIRTIDQPSYDGANIYFVSKAASKYVSVALSGLGGDEMFFGYPHFTSLYKAAQQKVRFTDHMYRIINDLRPNRFTNISALRCQSLPQRYAGVRRILNDNAIVKALSQTMNAHFSFNFMEAYIQSFIDESLPSLDQTVLVECRHYLRNTLLRDADVMSMGHGIEVRPVMLDNILVEHVSALPQEIKVKNGWHKALLIDSIRDLLPPDILNRPKKGFELPLGYWLRTVLRQRFFDCIESPTSKLIFNKNFLDKCKENIYNTGMTPLSWTILILVSWIKEYNCVISD